MLRERLKDELKKSMLAKEIATTEPAVVDQALAAGLETLDADIDVYANWGEMHRLRIAHPLSFLPLIGGRYRFGDYPIGGSSDTLMKTAHGSTGERQEALSAYQRALAIHEKMVKSYRVQRDLQLRLEKRGLDS